ncbi:SMP-30/gluconolactonase/LRE family protein [Streptomyces prasinosporus]|uniref:SMP-30/gluconolactonase/LRE family protein n=1 Tax=Streptomyces prasinosporus TaxID=68256 RepID=A0ABP6UBC9_9ACTN
MLNGLRRVHRALLPAALVLSTALLPSTALALPVAAGADGAGPAAADTALPSVISGSGTAIHPEGVTWDPTRSAFLIGSLRHGTVSVVGADGTPRTLIDDPELIATGAIRVDVPRNRLLVTYDDVYAGPDALLSVGSTPETRGRHAGLAVYDLRTGQLQRRIDLGEAPGLHLANDIALDPRGNAYVTDSFSGHIFKVTPSGRKSTFLYDPALDAGADENGLPNVGVNGIVHHPDGYLLVVRYDTGAIFRIPLDRPQDFREVDLEQRVPGADGMALAPDGTLWAATNTIRSTGIDGVFRLRSDDGWRTGRTLSAQASPEAAPTTVAITPSGGYVLSSNLNVLFGSGGSQTRDGFVLRRY